MIVQRKKNNYFVDIYNFVLGFKESDVKVQEDEVLEFSIATFEEIQDYAKKIGFLHYESMKPAFDKINTNQLNLKKQSPSMDAWLKEAKADPVAAKVGMFLVHNGVVRETAKAKVRNGEDVSDVKGMEFSYDEQKVADAIAETYKLEPQQGTAPLRYLNPQTWQPIESPQWCPCICCILRFTSGCDCQRYALERCQRSGSLECTVSSN